MAIRDFLLPEFDHEMATTRKVLALTPEKQAMWRPHQKSFTIGEMVTHIAQIPVWGAIALRETELDLNPVSGEKILTPKFESTAELVSRFDRNVAEARELIAAASDEDFRVPWTLKNQGKVIFTMPRAGVMRGMVLSHLIHHRGQFSVYLRLQDVPLPSIYGPSADSPS